MKTYAELKALIEQRGVHPEFGAAGEGWGIEQNPHELATFLVRMQELGITSCLEIGTGYKGGLSRFLAQDMGWRVTSVDIQDYGHQFEGVEYLIGEEAITPKADMVFIDGNHSYESVKHDYGYYGCAATKVLALHDIAGLRNCEGSRVFWQEIAGQPPGFGYYEIIDDNSQRSGIGMIIKSYAEGESIDAITGKVFRISRPLGVTTSDKPGESAK